MRLGPYSMRCGLICRIGYSEEVDWWSLGCVFFEVTLGLPPFTGDSPEEVKFILNLSLFFFSLSCAFVYVAHDCRFSPTSRIGGSLLVLSACIFLIVTGKSSHHF